MRNSAKNPARKCGRGSMYQRIRSKRRCSLERIIVIKPIVYRGIRIAVHNDVGILEANDFNLCSFILFHKLLLSVLRIAICLDGFAVAIECRNAVVSMLHARIDGAVRIHVQNEVDVIHRTCRDRERTVCVAVEGVRLVQILRADAADPDLILCLFGRCRRNQFDRVGVVVRCRIRLSGRNRVSVHSDRRDRRVVLHRQNDAQCGVGVERKGNAGAFDRAAAERLGEYGIRRCGFYLLNNQ